MQLRAARWHLYRSGMNWMSVPNFRANSRRQCSCHSVPSHCSRITDHPTQGKG
jgi:hypothetical protein